MLALLSPVVRFVNKKRDVVTDTKIFRLHTIVVPAVLMVLSLFLALKEYVGSPMICLGDDKDSFQRIEFANVYCWVSSTYTVDDFFDPNPNSRVYSRTLPIYPGVGTLPKDGKVTFHRFYFWTPFFLFYLSIFFYSPRYIWKCGESGYMKMLVEKLDSPIVEEEVKKTRLKLLISYFHGGSSYHNKSYAFTFFTCEVFNWLVVLASFVLTDLLLGGAFATYGWDVIAYLRRPRIPNSKWMSSFGNPMHRVFPKITKCQMTIYGPSGNAIPLEYLCIPGLNNCNDKIFLFLWLAFIGLLFTSGLAVLYRIIVILSTKLRKLKLNPFPYNCFPARLQFRCKNTANNFDEEQAIGGGESIGQEQASTEEGTPPSSSFSPFRRVGDWFVLHQLQLNIDRLTFAELLKGLEEEQEKEEEHNKKSV